MIDDTIIIFLSKRHGFLNFLGLIEYMKRSNLKYQDKRLIGSLGLATFDSIIIDLTMLNKYDNNLVFHVFLHETAHMKRIKKLGPDNILKLLSDTNFEAYCNHIFTEEIIADRFSSLLFLKLNKFIIKNSYSQNLHLKDNQTKYLGVITQNFNVIKNDINKYNNLVESYIIK